MQERRTAERFRTNLNVRWESLGSQGRGSVCDLSSTGCFVLTGGEVIPRELIRLELVGPEEITPLWGHVIYQIREMGFAVRFAVTRDDERESIARLIAGLVQH